MGVFHFFKIVRMVPNRAMHHICDLEILFGVYKSNMTLMSFQRKTNVLVWSPRPFNVEITSTKQYFPDFKFQI